MHASPHFAPRPRAARLARLAMLALLASSPASAEIYYLVQPDGSVSFTDTPTDPRYRIWREPDRPGSLRPRLHGPGLDRAIVRHARAHRLDPNLVRAVIKAESDFDPTAVSKAGALGLMQLMPETARRLAVSDAFDPEENIGAGVRHLRALLDRFGGDLALALAAYHAGARRVEEGWRVPPLDETRRYVEKVLRFYRTFSRTSSTATRGDREPAVSVSLPPRRE